MDTRQFEERKREHIRLALDPANQADGQNGLDRFQLDHDSLPELDFSEVSLQDFSLGRPISTPFYVAGMTAGHPDAPKLNRELALACATRGWGMGVGSQRRDIEGLPGGSLDQWKLIRDEAPGIELFANIGLAQLIGVPVEAVRELVENLGGRALAVHLNPLQEVMQPEGTPTYKGGIQAIRRLVEQMDVPVLLKETGCGFSRATLTRLKDIRISAIDVSGLGGTHWGRIEGARATGIRQEAARTFGNWGVSTLDSVVNTRAVLPSVEAWASGGVRTGLDAAKLIALGARRVGFARPALEAALEGPESLRTWMELREFELKVALFCTGCRTPEELRRRYDGARERFIRI